MTKINLPESAVSALMQGRKIDAIKIVREEQNLDLKEAHDLVNQYIRENPAIQENFKSVSGDSMLRFIAIAIIIGIVVYLLK